MFMSRSKIKLIMNKFINDKFLITFILNIIYVLTLEINLLSSHALDVKYRLQMNLNILEKLCQILDKDIIIIIMNLITDQSCDHAVLKSSKHAGKSERSKNSHLNLLYIYCSFSAVCSNYLASVMSTSLDLSSLNSC